MSGEWSGGAANWSWQRPGSRLRAQPRDRERDQRLYELLKVERGERIVPGRMGRHPAAGAPLEAAMPP